MRVVGGKYKGLRFSPPKKFPSRPTTDFAKESLFNILDHQFYFENKSVLDLCAGTGNISLEFLSRGVAEVWSVDEHPISLKHLHKLKASFPDENWEIIRGDAFEYLQKVNRTFDFIFADPPFIEGKTIEIPDLVFSRNLLTGKGCLIVEHGRENDFSSHPRFVSSRNYGGVQFSFFELPDEEE